MLNDRWEPLKSFFKSGHAWKAAQLKNEIMLHIPMGEPLSDSTANELLSITEFSARINQVLHEFLQIILLVNRAGQDSAYQTEQLSQQMNVFLNLAEEINATSAEAHLLALNTLVESAKCGKPAAHMAEVATQVEGLAAQSRGFGLEIREEVYATQASIHHIKLLILKISQQEFEDFISIKGRVDVYLGGLMMIEKIIGSLPVLNREDAFRWHGMAQETMESLVSEVHLLKEKAGLFALHESMGINQLEHLEKLVQACERLEQVKLSDL